MSFKFQGYIFLFKREKISELFWAVGIDCAADTSDDQFIATANKWDKRGYAVLSSEKGNFVKIPVRVRDARTGFKTTTTKVWKFYHLRQCRKIHTDRPDGLIAEIIDAEEAERTKDRRALRAAEAAIDGGNS